VVSLEFKFPAEPQHEPLVLDKSYIDKHARPGESYEQARERLSGSVGNQ